MQQNDTEFGLTRNHGASNQTRLNAEYARLQDLHDIKAGRMTVDELIGCVKQNIQMVQANMAAANESDFTAADLSEYAT